MKTAVALAHISVIDWMLIVLFSGVAAALLNQAGTWIIGITQSRNQRRMAQNDQVFKERMQKDEREHQSLQLLIAAHFDQREKLLKNAVDAREWIWRRYYTQYGLNHDYHGNYEPIGNLASIDDVINALNNIRYFHPTRSIREKASDLEGYISGHFNSTDSYSDKGPIDPSERQLETWLDAADKLIELIHTPPTLDEIRNPKPKN